LVQFFQTKKIRKRRKPLPLKESRLLWKQQQFVSEAQLNPDHLNGIRNNITPSSSASSECSGSGSWSSKRKRRLYKSYMNNNNNNNNNNISEVKLENPESKLEQTEPGIMTRNRSRELRSGDRKVIVGRRIIGPGVYEYLVENET
jgi:hypothetical protein